MKNEYENTPKMLGGEGMTPPLRVFSNISNEIQEDNINEDEVSLCIDWLSCSFDFYQHSARHSAPRSPEEKEFLEGLHKLKRLFEILTFPDSSEIQYNENAKGEYREGVYTLGEHIKIFLSGPVNKNNLPTNFLDMSGQACREFERRGGDYAKLYRFITLNGGNFTRNDGAIDVYTNKYFDMNKIGRYVDNGWYSSPSSKGKVNRDWGDYGPTTEGIGYYFGSKYSNTLILIYDKKLERFYNGVETFTPAWYRVEIRFKGDRADWFVQNFLLHYEKDNDFSFIQEALYKYLKFKVPVIISKSTGKRIKSKNKSVKDWCDALWWSRFLNVSKEAKFKQKELPELSIEKNKRHIERSDSKILARIFNADPDSFFSFIMQLVHIGHGKLEITDYTAINEYRRQSGMDDLGDEGIVNNTITIRNILKGIGGKVDDSEIK